MEKVAKIVSTQMVRHNIINEEDKCFYRFALECMLIYLINIGTMLGLAIWMKKFVECCFFLIIFYPLRTYCGGFHMKTWYSCYIASCGIISLILFLSEVVVIGYPVLLVGLIFSNVIIWKLAPCVHENHPLEREEITKAKKKARAYGVIISVIAVGAKVLGMNVAVWLSFSAMCLSAGLVVLGQWCGNKNKKLENVVNLTLP